MCVQSDAVQPVLLRLWSNSHCVRWLCKVCGLHDDRHSQYIEKLHSSGLHGAFLFLEGADVTSVPILKDQTAKPSTVAARVCEALGYTQSNAPKKLTKRLITATEALYAARSGAHSAQPPAHIVHTSDQANALAKVLQSGEALAAAQRRSSATSKE